MRLFPTTPVPGTRKIDWYAQDPFDLVGGQYVGPEVNRIPHRIEAVGDCNQLSRTIDGVEIHEGWLCFRLEGGLVVGTEDPAEHPRDYEVYVHQHIRGTK